jgi:hypothetical protein
MRTSKTPKSGKPVDGPQSECPYYRGFGDDVLDMWSIMIIIEFFIILAFIIWCARRYP